MAVCSFRRMAAAFITGVAMLSSPLLLADAVYTPAGGSRGTALTVAEVEAVVIDGGQDAVVMTGSSVAADTLIGVEGLLGQVQARCPGRTLGASQCLARRHGDIPALI